MRLLHEKQLRGEKKMKSRSIQRKKALAILPVAVVLLLVAAAIIPMLADKGNNEKADAAEPGFPFYLGLARGPEQIEPLLTYTFGDSPGTVPMDKIPNYPISDLFGQFETKPVSNHPDGTAFIWIYDDALNVYFVADWTSDNTYDDGADYCAVYVKDGSGVKKYSQHSDGGLYGTSFFAATGSADFEHMVYIIAVPKADLNSSTIIVGFEMYGTAIASLFTTAWSGTPPTTAVVNATVNFTISYDLFYNAEDPNAFRNMKAIAFEYNTATNLNNFIAANVTADAGGFFDSLYFDATGWKRHHFSPTGIKYLASKDFNPVEVVGGGVTTAAGTVTIPLKFTTAGAHNIGILCYDGSGSDEVGPYFIPWLVAPLTVTVNVTAGFTPVTDITGVPTIAIAGTPLALTGTVVPAGATNQTIVWSVKDAGATNATISGSELSATNKGNVVVTATIAEGTAIGAAFSKDFTIEVFVPVTNISGIPSSVTVGQSVVLEGVVEPSDATNSTIVWSIKDAGDTGATISGNTLTTTATGSVTITATIANGTEPGTSYVQDFTIAVNEQGSGMIGLWLGIAALVLLFIVYFVLKYVLKKNI